MRRKFMFTVAVILSILSLCMTAYAGDWKNDANGWWYSFSDGRSPKESWIQDSNGKWYYFDQSGYMLENQWIEGYYVGADGALVGDICASDLSYRDANGEAYFKTVPLTNAARTAYDSFVKLKKYTPYTSSWEMNAETYTILDINQDQNPELIINSFDRGSFYDSIIFTYNSQLQKVVPVTTFYHFGNLRYSSKYQTIEYSTFRPNINIGDGEYDAISGNSMVNLFTVSWDHTSGDNGYILSQGSTEKEISEQEGQNLFDSLNKIYFQNLPV